ncbi:hypothetical protein V8E36_003945 [Tilletia maclaganii]
MSVKQHLDESRNPSISAESESQYSSSASTPSTPEAVDDTSPRMSPSTAPPATPLIFRSHFVGNCKAAQAESVKDFSSVEIKAETLDLPRFTDQSSAAIARGPVTPDEAAPPTSEAAECAHFIQHMPGGGMTPKAAERADRELEGLGPASPAGKALADYFRMREQGFPSRSSAPASPQLSASECTNSLLAAVSTTRERASSLLSPAKISDPRRSTDVDGPWWMLNERWSEWQAKDKEDIKETGSLSSNEGLQSPRSVTSMHCEVNGTVFEFETGVHTRARSKDLPLAPVQQVCSHPREAASDSSSSSPASIIVAAQRRAWLEHFYPQGDLSRRPHLAQLAELRLPSSVELTKSCFRGERDQFLMAHHQDRLVGLGSPFNYDSNNKTDQVDAGTAGDDVTPAAYGEEQEDKENRPIVGSTSLKRKPTLSFANSRSMRKRAQSTIASRPLPPLELRLSTFSTQNAGATPTRARANSDSSVPPSAASLTAHFDLSALTLSRALATAFGGAGPAEGQTKEIKSLLDEQVFTPLRPCPPDMLPALGAQELKSISNRPFLEPIFGRSRSSTTADKVTFEEPVYPLCSPAPPKRSNSTGSATGMSPASRLSRLLRGRLQIVRSVVTTPQEVDVQPLTVLSTPSIGGPREQFGFGQANPAVLSSRCSLEEWEMSPSSPAMGLHLRLRSCTTSGDTDLDGDADTQTECSTAPSTPTIPAHLLNPAWCDRDSPGSIFSDTRSKHRPLARSTSCDVLTSHLATSTDSSDKPLPLPRVELDAALRLRPSLGDLRSRKKKEGSHHGSDSSFRSGTQAHSILDEIAGFGATATSSSSHFRKLRAGWEARTRLLQEEQQQQQVQRHSCDRAGDEAGASSPTKTKARFRSLTTSTTQPARIGIGVDIEILGVA